MYLHDMEYINLYTIYNERISNQKYVGAIRRRILILCIQPIRLLKLHSQIDDLYLLYINKCTDFYFLI